MRPDTKLLIVASFIVCGLIGALAQKTGHPFAIGTGAAYVFYLLTTPSFLKQRFLFWVRTFMSVAVGVPLYAIIMGIAFGVSYLLQSNTPLWYGGGACVAVFLAIFFQAD